MYGLVTGMVGMVDVEDNVAASAIPTAVPKPKCRPFSPDKSPMLECTCKVRLRLLSCEGTRRTKMSYEDGNFPDGLDVSYQEPREEIAVADSAARSALDWAQPSRLPSLAR